MGDDHDLYLRADVSLLADVFQKFLDMCLKYQGLDHFYYCSSPGLNWDAMLKMTKTKLELFQTLPCIYFIKKE